MKLLDSDFLIALLREQPDAVTWVNNVQGRDMKIATTLINAHEILLGATKERYQRTEAFLKHFNVLPFDWQAMHQATEIRDTLLSEGTPIGVLDEFIAAICLAHDATLVTRDDHFKHVPELTVETW